MERKETNQMLKPAKIGAILLVAAVILGVLVMVLSSPKKESNRADSATDI